MTQSILNGLPPILLQKLYDNSVYVTYLRQPKSVQKQLMKIINATGNYCYQMLMESNNQYKLLQNKGRASSYVDVTWSDQVMVSLGKIFIY